MLETNQKIETAEEAVGDTTGKDTTAEKMETKAGSKRQSVKSAVKEKNSEQPEIPEAKKQALVYLGPNIPGGILFTGSVYKEKPDYLKELFAKMPEAEELFVEVRDVPAFKQELERQGSGASMLYQNIVNMIKEEAKEANRRNGRV